MGANECHLMKVLQGTIPLTCHCVRHAPVSRHSSVIEVILVLTHSHWWDTSYMEHVMYFALKYLSSILHDINIFILQNFMVDKLMIKDTDSVCEI